jgi:hypothetical protein
MKKISKKPPTARLWIGIIVLVIGFLSPLLIPLVLSSGLSTGVISVISGMLAFGIPELFMIIAIGIMGKDGFNYLKRYMSLVLRRYGPPDEVSLLRYRIGLSMFFLPLLVSFITPYLSHKVSFFNDSEVTIMLILHGMLFLSLFILGGDFWDKLRGLFIRGAKIKFEITINNHKNP